MRHLIVPVLVLVILTQVAINIANQQWLQRAYAREATYQQLVESCTSTLRRQTTAIENYTRAQQPR